MERDDAPMGRFLPHELRNASGYVPMARAVKTVPPNAVLPIKSEWKRVVVGRFWECRVEGCIKNRDLPQSRKCGLCCKNPSEVVGVV